MVEIVKFLARRARRERKGWLNWPIGTPIELGDIGRTSRRIFVTEGQGSLASLGIDCQRKSDTKPDLVDWQYSEDKELELFVKAKTGDQGIPAWSGLSGGEIGFSAKFGSEGSYRMLIPELRWERIEVTPELIAALKGARRDGLIRRRDRIVVGIGVATSYTLLVSITQNSTIDFTADAQFSNIADASAGFKFKHSRGAVERYVGHSGGVLFVRLAKARWSGELVTRAEPAHADLAREEEEVHLVDADLFSEDELDDVA